MVLNRHPELTYHANDQGNIVQSHVNDGHNRDDHHGSRDDDRDGQMHMMEYRNGWLRHDAHYMDRNLDTKCGLKYQVDSNTMLLDC